EHAGDAGVLVDDLVGVVLGGEPGDHVLPFAVVAQHLDVQQAGAGDGRDLEPTVGLGPPVLVGGPRGDAGAFVDGVLVHPLVRPERPVEDVPTHGLAGIAVGDLPGQYHAARQVEVGGHGRSLRLVVGAGREAVHRTFAPLGGGGEDVLLRPGQAVQRVPPLGVGDGLHVGKDEPAGPEVVALVHLPQDADAG